MDQSSYTVYRQLKAIVLHPHPEVGIHLRSLLEELGLHHVTIMRDVSEVLAVTEQEQFKEIGLIIADQAESHSALKLIRSLRGHKRDILQKVICITSPQDSISNLALWAHIGLSRMLLRPVSKKELALKVAIIHKQKIS